MRHEALAWYVACSHGIGIVGDPDHQVTVLPVNLEEGPGLMGQLPLHIRGAEDALQVCPALLAPHPGLQHLSKPMQVMLQLLHRLPYACDIPA